MLPEISKFTLVSLRSQAGAWILNAEIVRKKLKNITSGSHEVTHNLVNARIKPCPLKSSRMQDKQIFLQRKLSVPDSLNVRWSFIK